MRKQLLAGAVAVAFATGMTTGAMAVERGGAGGLHGHSRNFHAGHSVTYAGIRRGGFRHGWHHGGSDRRFVGGDGGWGYSPSYSGGHYEGVAPFGRFVGPATGGVDLLCRHVSYAGIRLR